MINLKDVKQNQQILEFINQTEEAMEALSYTNHGLRHSNIVAERAMQIARNIGLDAREGELAAIAGFCHDMGNFLTRTYHHFFGATLFSQVFLDKFEPRELAMIMQAISNHDKEEMDFTHNISAILVLADKSDVDRSRVTEKDMAKITNQSNIRGTLKNALEGADVFIGLSTGNLLNSEDIKKMNPNAIIFAMANPTPEIMPEEAEKVDVGVMGTGRSDFPNQINNSLVFPGLFRGALDAKAIKINNEMKIAAAKAIANYVEPTKDNILPYTLDKGVVIKIAEAVKKAAIETNVCRI